MPTAAEVKKQQRHARKQRERDARKADRERLKQLRAHITGARKHGAVRRREIVRACQRGRLRAREFAAELRARARKQLHEQIDAARAASRRECEARKAQGRSRNTDSMQRANVALEAERKHQATVRRWTKPTRNTCSKAAVCRAVTALESDSEVRNNIPQDLAPVWDRVKSRIKSTARRTRTESFLEWAQEHAADVLAILDEKFTRDVEEMAKHEAELRREVANEKLYRKAHDRDLVHRAMRFRGKPAELQAVPF